MDVSLVRRSVRFYHRIGFQFSSILFVFSTVVLLALAAHTNILLDRSLLEADELPISSARRVAEAVDRHLMQLDAVARPISASLSFERAPDALAMSLLQRNVGLLHGALFDNRGVRRWSWEHSNSFIQTNAYAEREPFFVTALRGSLYIGQPFVVGDVPVSVWAYPLLDSNQETVIGVLYLLVDLRPLVALLNSLSHSAFIIDQTGNIRLDHLGVLHDVADDAEHPIAHAYLNRNDGVLAYNAHDGTRMLGTWVPLRHAPWGIGVEMTLRSVFEDFYFSLTLLGILFFSLVVLVGYMGYFFYKEINVPVSVIQKAVVAFANGDIHARVRESKENELGILAQTFDMLADRIESEPNRLRLEVERRTEELQKVNQKLQALVREVQENARQILEKEKQLISANESFEQANRELERVGKILVKRDRELTAANKRLEELDSTKSEFVSVAAHQLRTPLTGIKWSLKSLANEEFGALTHEQLSAIKNGLSAAESAITLINDLLDVARIEEGRYGFHFSVGPLALVLQGAYERQIRRAEKKGISLTLAAVPDSICIELDAERLGIAIENAIDNAIKYTPPNGNISIETKVEKMHVEVCVRDSGIGIPEDQQHKLFSKFFRAPNAMLMQTAGTGLGLYLMKNIVERHGGTVRIESKEGAGTSVIFRFPRVACAAAPSPADAPATT